MENDYRITKLHGTFIGDNRIPDLPAGEKTKIFSSTNGKTAWVDLPEGGKSVPPTLVLTDLSGDEPVTKSFLTEEEKTNLEKGLYNQVFYIDTSIGVPNRYFSNYFPEIYNAEAGGFFIYAGTLDTKEGEEFPTLNPTHLYGYNIEIAEKDSSGNYPITITRAIELPLTSQGGGNSLTLKLIDFSTGEQKTSLTEEEKTNLEAGRYGFISYYDASWGDAGEYMAIFPQLLGCFNGSYFALIYNVSTVVNDVPLVSGLLGYAIEIGEKNTDDMYPLTIEKSIEIPFGGGSGGSSTSIAFKDVTVSELANHVGEFGNFHITDLKLVYDSFLGPQEFTGGYFIGTVASSTALAGVMWVVVDTQSNQTAYYKSDNFSISNGKITLQQTETLGVIKSLPFPKKINSQDGYNFLSEVIDTGSIVYAGEADIDSSSISHLILGLSSNVVPTATGDEEYCHFDCIVEEKGIGRLSLKKDANNIPQFKSFTTWLPPITAADEGKSLVVKNGNGKWATIDTSNYGKLDALSSNDWNSSNVFRGVTTLHSPTIVGGISSDGGGDQILIDQDLSEHFGSLFKRVTGFVSTYQTPTSVAFEALGFINENAFGDLSKASVLSFVSTTGKSQWIEPSTNTKYNYQLPKKSGTIALTSDLSEAGTSVTIRRW